MQATIEGIWSGGSYRRTGRGIVGEYIFDGRGGVCIQGLDVQHAAAKMLFRVDHGFSASENK